MNRAAIATKNLASLRIFWKCVLPQWTTEGKLLGGAGSRLDGISPYPPQETVWPPNVRQLGLQESSCTQPQHSSTSRQHPSQLSTITAMSVA